MTTRLLAVTLVTGAAAVALGCGTPSVEHVDTDTPVPVSVSAATVGPLTTVVSASGTVVPAPGADWTIIAPEPGRIAELPMVEGAVVHTGDLLARFDIPTLPAEVAARKADIAQARVKVDTARAAVTRLTGLVAQGVAAPRELEEARSDQAEAEAALAQADSASEAAVALAARATVTATFDGVVAKRWHNPGDLVDASSSDPVLRVINPRALQVVASVPLADLDHVVVGHHAEITGPSGHDDAGTVVSKPAQVDAGSATADVRLAFTGVTTVPAGAVVGVSIVADSRPQVLTVPAAAIVRDGDDTYVMVAGGDQHAHKHPVTVGLTARERVEVLSGVSAGDQVIVRGQTGLPDKAAITVVK